MGEAPGTLRSSVEKDKIDELHVSDDHAHLMQFIKDLKIVDSQRSRSQEPLTHAEEELQ